MKIPSLLALVLGNSAFCSISHANITNMVWGAYNSGIVWHQYALDNNNTMTLGGDQYTSAGRMRCTLFADSPVDPTLTINNSIDNDTTFAWTGYHVDVSMNVNFTLSAAMVNSPGDWSSFITQQPTLVGGLYVGQLDFQAGTPIAVGQIFDFTYKATFSGATQYSFTQTLTPVPEPATVGLIGLGIGVLAIARRRLAGA
jgi:hypothetical protein